MATMQRQLALLPLTRRAPADELGRQQSLAHPVKKRMKKTNHHPPIKPEHLRNRILAADLAWIPVALAAEQMLCSGVRCRHLPLGAANFIFYVVCTLLAWVLLSENLHLDGFRGGWRMPSLVSHLLLAIILLMVLLLAVQSVSERYVGRFTLSAFSLFLFAGFLGIRRFALRRVLRQYKNGEVHRVVILGSDRLASELAAKFKRHPELLCEVTGFLCPEAELPAARPIAASATGAATVSSMEVIRLLRQHRVDEHILAHSPFSNEILNLIALCRQQAIRVSLVPQPYELYLSKPTLLDLGGLPLLQLADVATPAPARLGRRCFDIVLSLVFSLLTLPIVLTSAAALRLSTGAAFRWETRIGLGGKQFSMLRLNVDRDPQNTSRYQRLLWQISISELPQLWNVLRGEMSLVGPRPEGPQRADCYSTWQQQRLSIKPGMTGLAQVHGLRECHPSEDKTRHDLQYILHATLLKDTSLLIETMWTLASRLIALLGRDARTVNDTAAESQKNLFSASTQTFPEILQNAHRTQPGSD
jgi:lipopolysaccharide/colanic/teichoic acid biosynthesis glycosyltransferase